MKGLSDFLVPYLVSNTVAVLILALAVWRPRVGRLLLFLLFAWASVTNWHYAHTSPSFYLEYADLSIPLYSHLILGWFSHHVTLMVSLIAVGQAMIAIGMLLKGWWVNIACLGAIVFLLAIAPLGVGSAFPFSITASVACAVVIAKDRKQLLWLGEKHQKAK